MQAVYLEHIIDKIVVPVPFLLIELAQQALRILF